MKKLDKFESYKAFTLIDIFFVMTIVFLLSLISYILIYWWVKDPNSKIRFTWPYLIWNISAYKDSILWKKWESIDLSDTIRWANDESNIEPVWNWYEYEYFNLEERDYPAFKYCTDKWAWWRMPTKKELFSLMTDLEKNSNNYFTQLNSISNDTYWSSSSFSDNKNLVWYWDFNNSNVISSVKNYKRHVLCIHD